MWDDHEVYTGSAEYAGTERWQHHGETLTTKPEIYSKGRKGEKRVKVSSFCQLCNAWYGAYGLEPTLQMYIDHTVEWCREVWRVLRDDGTFWLNIGDSYAGSGGAGGDYNEGGLRAGQPKYPGTNRSSGFRKQEVEYFPYQEHTRRAGGQRGFKPKDLMMVPARIAIALQEDGWWIRNDIIWHKTNPMPESATDRCTKSHEYLFLLTKNKNYYYDQDAIREGYKTNDGSTSNVAGFRETPPGQSDHTGRDKQRTEFYNHTGRNRRTVWTIATAPYSGAHFATYPPALIEPCIKAGTSEHGVCPECGAQWERVVEKVDTGETQKMPDGFATHEGDHGSIHRSGREKGEAGKPVMASQTIGWQPTCTHDLEPVPAKVFDPFLGSGTSILVARKLGRIGIGTDLSLEYLGLARERLSLDVLDDWENKRSKDGETSLDDLPMFTDQA